MANAKLDTSRPYAQLYGPGDETEGAVHTQDGFFYDHDDMIMPSHHLYTKAQASEAALSFAEYEAEPPPEQVTITRAKEVAERIVSQRKPAPVKSPAPPPPPAPPKRTGNKAEDVDLRAWALSEMGYPFMAVRAAINSRYAFQAHNADAARAFLVDQGVIKESDLE